MKDKAQKENKRLLTTAHQMAEGLREAGVIDAVMMKEFDVLCLPVVNDLSASAIKKIRLHEKVSQAVFAKILNTSTSTSTSTVKQWEQGDKHPRGTSLKLLNLVAQKGLEIMF